MEKITNHYTKSTEKMKEGTKQKFETIFKDLYFLPIINSCLC